MGFSLAWLAVRGKSAETVRNELGLCATADREESPDSDMTGISMPSGWYLIIVNRDGHKLMNEKYMQLVSTSAELVTCDVEEHVMVSVATGWKNGQKIWSVEHDAQKNVLNLTSEGDLPVMYNAVRLQLEAKQQTAGGEEADVDYIFDIPVKLAEKLTGFRHDKLIPELGECPFEILIARESPIRRPSFLKRLLGK